MDDATSSRRDEDDESVETLTVNIRDAHGTVTVPIKPKNVVALDNRTFETLSDWGIKLAAVPKGVMLTDSPYVADESVLDIGNHREPNLEIIAAVDPDLVIIGQRFAPGENLVNGLKDSTISLGQIFDKNEEARQLVADFDRAVAMYCCFWNSRRDYEGRDFDRYF